MNRSRISLKGRAFPARHESKCTVLNEDLISCSSELPEGISSEENNQRGKTLDDVLNRTYTSLSSESVPECPLTRLEKGPCNVPVSEVIKEPFVKRGASEVCDLDIHGKASAVQCRTHMSATKM